MGKSDETQTKTRAHKATDSDNSKHLKLEAIIKARVETVRKSSPLAASFDDNNDGGLHHARWGVKFRQMCEFKVKLGHCRVPPNYAANPKLGRWVYDQQIRYRKIKEEEASSVTAERIRALNGIGFDWGTAKNSSWGERFQQLCEFKEQFGHCLVPNSYADNPKLGRWVTTQRIQRTCYQKGRARHIKVEHIRKLDDIGFEWEPRDLKGTDDYNNCAKEGIRCQPQARELGFDSALSPQEIPERKT